MICEEKTDAPTIRFKGIMDFDGLFRFIYGWLKGKGYLVQEKKYSEKAELEIKWDAEKDVTDYYRYRIVIEFLGWDLGKIEMIDEKTKLKRILDTGRIEIKIKGAVEEDYHNEWEKTWLKKKLFVVYRNMTHAATEDIHGIYVIQTIYGLYNAIKEYLNMST